MLPAGDGGGGAGAVPAVAMNEAVVRRTQECLGQVIRKPPLTDRLLSKPPFRYLHDVITEVGRGPACGPALLLLGNRASPAGCPSRGGAQRGGAPSPRGPGGSRAPPGGWGCNPSWVGGTGVSWGSWLAAGGLFCDVPCWKTVAFYFSIIVINNNSQSTATKRCSAEASKCP